MVLEEGEEPPAPALSIPMMTTGTRREHGTRRVAPAPVVLGGAVMAIATVPLQGLVVRVASSSDAENPSPSSKIYYSQPTRRKAVLSGPERIHFYNCVSVLAGNMERFKMRKDAL